MFLLRSYLNIHSPSLSALVLSWSCSACSFSVTSVLMFISFLYFLLCCFLKPSELDTFTQTAIGHLLLFGNWLHLSPIDVKWICCPWLQWGRIFKLTCPTFLGCLKSRKLWSPWAVQIQWSVPCKMLPSYKTIACLAFQYYQNTLAGFLLRLKKVR